MKKLRILTRKKHVGASACWYDFIYLKARQQFYFHSHKIIKRLYKMQKRKYKVHLITSRMSIQERIQRNLLRGRTDNKKRNAYRAVMSVWKYTSTNVIILITKNFKTRGLILPSPLLGFINLSIAFLEKL